jgi:hypothetical protein
MPPGPPPLLELPGPVLDAVVSHLGPHAARLRPVSRGCRDAVDASTREVGLLVRADEGRDLVSLLALLRKSTALRAVELRFNPAFSYHPQAQALAVAPVLSALWTTPRLEVRAWGPMDSDGPGTRPPGRA